MALQEPKRPQTAYFFYLNEMRSTIQTELGTKEVGKIGKEASTRWNALGAEQKKKFETMAVEAKAQYAKDMEAFKAAGGEAGKARKDKADAKKARQAKAEKKEANKDKPKAPVGGAYGVYSNKHRAEVQKTLPAGSAVTAVSKALSEKFKALSDAEKKPYEEEYKQLKAKYDEELKAWKESKAASGEPAEEEGAAEASPTKASPAKAKAKAKGAAKKRAEPEQPAASPPAKKAKGRGKGAKAVAEGPSIDAAVLKKAEELNLVSPLKNLAGRGEMKGVTHAKMLAALETSGGLVNKAKASLLGA